MEAEEILLAKLSQIGMAEINIYKITRYQYESVIFYEIEFTPSYGGMGVIHEFGSITLGEIFPSGKAWICEVHIRVHPDNMHLFHMKSLLSFVHPIIYK